MPTPDPLHDSDFAQRAQEKMQAFGKMQKDPVLYRGECLLQAELILSSLQASYDAQRKCCREALLEWIGQVREIIERILRPAGVFRGVGDKKALLELCRAEVELTEQTVPLRSELARFLQWEREAEESAAHLTHLCEGAVLLRSAATGEAKAQWDMLARELFERTEALSRLRDLFSPQRSALLGFAASGLPRFQREFSKRCDFSHQGEALSQRDLRSLLGEMERAVLSLGAQLQNT